MIKTKKIWCDECRFMVYGCEHLIKRDATVETPADIVPGKSQLVFLSFNAVVPGCCETTIVQHPQIRIKPRRLVVDPLVAPDFMLVDICLGNMSSMAAAPGGGVSCAVFPPTPPRYEPVANLLGLPIVEVGRIVTLRLMNRAPMTREFSALMWCDAPIEEPTSRIR
jgi:hypothetical protein